MLALRARTRSTTLLRTLGSPILTKARLSSSPSRLFRNSRMKASEFRLAHAARGCTVAADMRCFFEEELHRHIEDLRDLEQPARADAVHALLVFLNLLEGQSHAFAKSLLAHAKQHTAQSHPASDMLVNRVRLLACHSLARKRHDQSKKGKLTHNLDENGPLRASFIGGVVYGRQANNNLTQL